MADMGTPEGEGTGFSKRLGPLPYWAWVAIVTAGAVVGWVWWRSRKGGDTPTATPQSTVVTADGIPTEQYESLLAILRDLQGKPSTEPGDTTPPPASTPPPDKKEYTAPAGISVPGWIRGLQAAGVDITYDELVKLNPNFNSNIHWGGADRNADRFINTATYRVA